ncbi:50S ribosomal subunit protein L18 [Desulfovibrionales bacterium]
MVMTKKELRVRRKIRIRKKIYGTAKRSRLVVYRSNRWIYCQLVDDQLGKILAAASSLTISKKTGNKCALTKETATKVGIEIARLANEQQIQKVVFDRNGYLYHGRIKALADGARDAGLQF